MQQNRAGGAAGAAAAGRRSLPSWGSRNPTRKAPSTHQYASQYASQYEDEVDTGAPKAAATFSFGSLKQTPPPKKGPYNPYPQKAPEYLKQMTARIQKQGGVGAAPGKAAPGKAAGDRTPKDIQQHKDTPPHIIPFEARHLRLNLAPPHGHLPPPVARPPPPRRELLPGFRRL